MTIRDHMCLQLAGRTYTHRGLQDAHARHELGLSAARMWWRVNELLCRPEVEAEYPQLVHRLRRLRDQRAAAAGRRATGWVF